ncbi:glycoside hydrolase family 3 N-terminal domain-containing protein [Streptomyces hirsutus]|uniref:glycoside hydrolase family 3 protein n=1 Tax=Streptomyces hirsutus TaxID=35620 RepID=UPI0036342E4C
MRSSPHARNTRTARRLGLALVAVLPLAVVPHGTAAAGNAGGHGGSGKNGKPSVESRVKDLLIRGGDRFRDLNDNGRLDPYENWRLPSKLRAHDLVGRMTTEEKAGTMLISTFDDTASRTVLDEDHLRYFIVRDDPEPKDLARRNNAFQELAEASRLGIPVVMTSNPRNHVNPSRTIGHAEAGGQLSTWPGELGLAATRDPRIVRDFARTAAREWRAVGIQKGYMYMADIATEPRWTRTDGTFGENPRLAADMISAVVKGFQGKELGPHSVAQTTKHAPGGGPRVEGKDPHHPWGQTNEYPTAGSLAKYHLPPLQAAIDAGSTSVMPYYARPENDGSAPQLPKKLRYTEKQQFEEVGFAFNKPILQGLVRDGMGFDGYINSDTGVIGDRAWGVEHLTEAEQYAKAIHAGTNLFSGGTDVAPLLEAIETRLVTKKQIDRSVTYLLTEMFDLGLFEDPYTDPDRAQRIADDPASQARADEAHRKSVVLLRNDERRGGRSVLPLTDQQAGAVKLYVEVFQERDSETQTTALCKLIHEYDPALTLVDSPADATHAYLHVAPSLAWSEDDTEDDGPSIELRKDSDTGIDSERILALQEQIDTVVLNVNMVNPWLIHEIEPGADAVLATFHTTHEAALDVIRGRFDPSGKLPFGIPADLAAVERNASDVPSYDEGYDYAYENAAGDTYAYGFGLSYE